MAEAGHEGGGKLLCSIKYCGQFSATQLRKAIAGLEQGLEQNGNKDVERPGSQIL